MNCIIHYKPQNGSVLLCEWVKTKMHTILSVFVFQAKIVCLRGIAFKQTLTWLAVFFIAGVSSAQSSKESRCITAASPGAFPSATAGPAWPAWPGTFLVNSRSCSCKNSARSRKRHCRDTECIISLYIPLCPYLGVELYHPWNSGRPGPQTGECTSIYTFHPAEQECLHCDMAYTYTHYTLPHILLWLVSDWLSWC